MKMFSMICIISQPCILVNTRLFVSYSLAKVAVELAKEKLVDATVLLHPARVTVDDIKGI